MRNVVLNRIGEDVYALFDGDNIAEIKISRPWQNQNAKTGQEYCARIKTIDLRLNAAFVDLGDEQALLQFSLPRPKYIVEGLAIIVKITRPKFADKLALCSFIGEASPKAKCPDLLKDVADWGDWPAPQIANQEETKKIQDLLFELASNIINLKNGGNIKIDKTRALTAIDIDAAGRIAGGTNQGNFNHKLNQIAAFEIARQIKLRNIGGLIIIDFVGAPSKLESQNLIEILQKDLKQNRKCEILPISKFGLCEITRARNGIEIGDILGDISTKAINAINALAQKLQNSKGAIINFKISHEINDFLQNWSFDWQKYLHENIGGSYEVQIENINDFEVY